ncbi:hypothetical protein Tco_0918916 [Tanacetum coccineum]
MLLLCTIVIGYVLVSGFLLKVKSNKNAITNAEGNKVSWVQMAYFVAIRTLDVQSPCEMQVHFVLYTKEGFHGLGDILFVRSLFIQSGGFDELDYSIAHLLPREYRFGSFQNQANKANCSFRAIEVESVDS